MGILFAFTVNVNRVLCTSLFLYPGFVPLVVTSYSFATLPTLFYFLRIKLMIFLNIKNSIKVQKLLSAWVVFN